jgi:hypothetical protein
LFLEIIVEIPKKFTPEQRALLEKLLPDDDDITDITGKNISLIIFLTVDH